MVIMEDRVDVHGVALCPAWESVLGAVARPGHRHTRYLRVEGASAISECCWPRTLF